MNGRNIFIYLVIAIGFAHINQNNLETVIDKLRQFFKSPHSCGDWEMYRKDKCFKLFDTLKTYDESLVLCEKQDRYSELISIKSEKEQRFIMNFLSKNSQSVDDVWIGAKRDQNNASNFLYQDKSSIDYNNLDSIDIKRSKGDCLVMQVNDNEENRVLNKWKIVSCKKNNRVLCEYMLNPTAAQLNVRVSDLADSVESNSEESNSKISDLADSVKSNSEESNSKIKKLKNELVEADNMIGTLNNDLSFSNMRIADLDETVIESKKTIDNLRKEAEEQNKRVEELKKTFEENRGFSIWQYFFILLITIITLILSVCIASNKNNHWS